MTVTVIRALAAGLLACSLLAAPSAAAAAEPAGQAARGETAPGVDINRAGVEELATLPGIGPALAGRIVEHRQKHGPFRKLEELLAVKGIGPKLLGKLRPHLVVRPPAGRD